VRYLFEQQLSEAQVIVVNKTDLLSEDKKLEAHELLRTRYPQAKVLNLSALTGDGLEVWLDSVLCVSNSEVNVLDLDYQRYAEAEAALGWLNAKGIVASNEAFSPVKWAENTFKSLSKTFEEDASPIAHIKMQFAVDSPKGLNPLFYKASLTGYESSINWDSAPESSSATRLEFTLNARVNTSPHRLEQAVVYALEFTRPNSGARFYFTDFDCFQPAPPKPTYRFVEVNE
jgi:G3E family GTPase